ncbi:Hypothetical predicted protein [Cloeon dipterum]|uniref:TPM domain-containing protein n=1 Tax=Cloeon dipterum TaxID=197152 RepID=A0A8S1DI98_9INSE|nr:Hypothetical predicted protein [Cloeon dipterum]
MRHLWTITLLLILLKSKFADSADADPFDEKCASLASKNANWNYQIPMNLSFDLIGSFKYSHIQKADAMWLEKIWEATKKNINWGTLDQGVTLVKGFALAEEIDSTTPLVVVIHADGTADCGNSINATTLSQLCSTSMKMADRSVVTLERMEDMFQPIADEELAKEIREFSHPEFSTYYVWVITALLVILVISLIISILFCCC